MKTYLLLFISIFCFQFTFAQIEWGIRAGIQTGSIEPGDLLTPDSLQIKAENANVGFRIGLFTRIQLASLYIQPEFLFRTSSNDFSISEVGDAIQQNREEDFQYIDIPILVGTKLGPLRVQGGPNISILLDDKSDITDIEGYSREFNTAEWALQAGVGLDIWRLAIDLNYQFNLTGREDEVQIGNNTFNLSGEESHFIVGVAYIFNKK